VTDILAEGVGKCMKDETGPTKLQQALEEMKRKLQSERVKSEMLTQHFSTQGSQSRVAEGSSNEKLEQELADAAALGDRTGMFNCPHTGVALAVLIKLLKAGTIDKAERVVVISTAHGLKFADFKVRYHEGTMEFPAQYTNRPIELPPRVEAVKEALAQSLQQRNKTGA